MLHGIAPRNEQKVVFPFYKRYKHWLEMMRGYRLLTSNQQRLHPTMRFLKLSLVLLLALLADGCKKPAPPKAGAENKEEALSSGNALTKPARPAESQPAPKTQANAPRSGKREKTAADWIPVLKDPDAARRIQAA